MRSRSARRLGIVAAASGMRSNHFNACSGCFAAIATRASKRIEREQAPSTEDETDALDMMLDAADTPAMRVLKDRCRGDLRAAFAFAFAELEPTERILLRQHYLDGLTTEAIGRLHGVHRATSARWIESIRENVLRGVLRHLRHVLGLSEDELGTALDLVRSQLDLSLSRHLPRITP